jgi:DNA-binding transcriptional LysR family regulator
LTEHRRDLITEYFSFVRNGRAGAPACLAAFSIQEPNVRVQVLVTNRYVDLIAGGIDVAFRFGALKDSSLVARKILSFRPRLVASPAYLRGVKAPRSPRDLLDHKLLAFSHPAAGRFGIIDAKSRRLFPSSRISR